MVCVVCVLVLAVLELPSLEEALMIATAEEEVATFTSVELVEAEDNSVTFFSGRKGEFSGVAKDIAVASEE